MINEIFEKDILIYVMLGICGLGVLLKIILGFVYKRLISSSIRMGDSNNKLVKTLRQNFESSYSANMGVNNVDIFVDKYIYRHKFCGILLYTWENICGQLLFLCMVCGLLGSLLGVLYDCGKNTILFTFFVGLSSSAVLLIVDNMMNLSTKRLVVKTNLVDYLENFMKLELQFVAPSPIPETVTREKKEINQEVKLQKDVKKMYEVNKREEKIIEDILKEYIV